MNLRVVMSVTMLMTMYDSVLVCSVFCIKCADIVSVCTVSAGISTSDFLDVRCALIKSMCMNGICYLNHTIWHNITLVISCSPSFLSCQVLRVAP